MHWKKILLVDDDAVVRKSFTIKLQSAGYSVVTATDGSEAVSAARRETPDLILLDVSLPADVGGVEWDGFRLMEWLKRVNEERKIPIIVITGGDPGKYKGKALASGATAFFQKPVQSEELLEVIRQTIGETTDEPEPQRK